MGRRYGVKFVSRLTASFGCKVLLCAAATTPGWSGIRYCVPVMQQLFRDLAHGGRWPSCSEGQASGISYDPYEACPAGLTAAQSSEDGTGAVTPAPNGNLCADLSKPQQSCPGGDAGCMTNYPTILRAARSNPYFVDINSANGEQRFYFSLQGF
ncbi:hypothetical protein [Nitrobacter sp.]|uniref:hypothetical protein n=1 Tax=Nitrobacter sp. TaxID=29420 RepID=UPI0029CAB823|nr:hypothetical protein [Nitrobacter sp.]